MDIKKPAHYLEKVINQISRVLGIIGIVFLMAMMLLTTLDVCLRYFFNAPITGSLELIEYFMVVAGFLGLAWCAIKGGHVKVDLVVGRMPPRFQAITDSTTMILALSVMPLVAWKGFTQTKYTIAQKTASPLLGIPAYPFYAAVGLGCAVLVLVLVVLLIQLLRKAIQR